MRLALALMALMALMATTPSSRSSSSSSSSGRSSSSPLEVAFANGEPVRRAGARGQAVLRTGQKHALQFIVTAPAPAPYALGMIGPSSSSMLSPPCLLLTWHIGSSHTSRYATPA